MLPDDNSLIIVVDNGETSMAREFTDAVFTVEDGVARFHMNRPDVLNALTPELVEDFAQLVNRVQSAPDIKALILSGEGRAFSAGGNVKGMGERQNVAPTDGRARVLALHDWLERLYDLDCPVIAAVDGLAFGGGLSLALVADFVLATPRSRFSAVFGRIGLIPDMGVIHTLPRLIGVQAAKEIMYTARALSAEEAKTLGLIYAIHEPEDLMTEADALARRLAQGSKNAIAVTKKLVNRSFNTDYRTMAEMEADGQALMFTTDYHKEAVRRFIDKEPPMYDWDALKDS